VLVVFALHNILPESIYLFARVEFADRVAIMVFFNKEEQMKFTKMHGLGNDVSRWEIRMLFFFAATWR